MAESEHTPAHPGPDGDEAFTGTMRNLASEAERMRGAASGAASAAGSKAATNGVLLAVGQMIRPLALGLESLQRAVTEQGHLLQKLAAPAPVPPAAAAESETLQSLDEVSRQLQRMGQVESANQKLFDALHTELKGYKDGFLFDALQKPFVRDLISVYDDLGSLHAQVARESATVSASAAAAPEAAAEGNGAGAAGGTGFLGLLADNLDNTRHLMLEIFQRLDVEPVHTSVGDPVDKRTHRILSFEPAAGPDEDGRVARSLRPGFSWRGRSVRPEEIVAKRWVAPPGEKPAAPEPPPAPPAAPAAPPEAAGPAGPSGEGLTLAAATTAGPLPPLPAALPAPAASPSEPADAPAPAAAATPVLTSPSVPDSSHE